MRRRRFEARICVPVGCGTESGLSPPPYVGKATLRPRSRLHRWFDGEMRPEKEEFVSFFSRVVIFSQTCLLQIAIKAKTWPVALVLQRDRKCNWPHMRFLFRVTEYPHLQEWEGKPIETVGGLCVIQQISLNKNTDKRHKNSVILSAFTVYKQQQKMASTVKWRSGWLNLAYAPQMFLCPCPFMWMRWNCNYVNCLLCIASINPLASISF